MEELKEKLKQKGKARVIAYIALVVVFIAIIGGMGVYTFIQSNKEVPTTSEKLDNNKKEETIENLTSVEGINSVEELQKLNEKEVEDSKKKDENSDKKNNNKTKSTPTYYIKVNYKAQVVTVYTKDAKGKYTKPVKAMVCSTGTYTPTSGVYKTPYRYRWLRMEGGVFAQYCTQIVGNILFHSVPYLTRGDHSSLEYWAYDQLGKRVSLGCVRLTCADAKWIYNNCKLGTQVEFYASSNPGPLGKPSARKISSAPASVRGWDPTDPAKGNPWKEYLKNLENNKDKPNTDKNNQNVENENTEINEPSTGNENAESGNIENTNTPENNNIPDIKNEEANNNSTQNEETSTEQTTEPSAKPSTEPDKEENTQKEE